MLISCLRIRSSSRSNGPSYCSRWKFRGDDTSTKDNKGAECLKLQLVLEDHLLEIEILGKLELSDVRVEIQVLIRFREFLGSRKQVENHRAFLAAQDLHFRGLQILLVVALDRGVLLKLGCQGLGVAAGDSAGDPIDRDPVVFLFHGRRVHVFRLQLCFANRQGAFPNHSQHGRRILVRSRIAVGIATLAPALSTVASTTATLPTHARQSDSDTAHRDATTPTAASTRPALVGVCRVIHEGRDVLNPRRIAQDLLGVGVTPFIHRLVLPGLIRLGGLDRGWLGFVRSLQSRLVRLCPSGGGYAEEEQVRLADHIGQSRQSTILTRSLATAFHKSATRRLIVRKYIAKTICKAPVQAKTTGAVKWGIRALTIRLPTGIPPRTARLYTLITRPRISSGMMVWTSVVVMENTAMRDAPARNSIAQAMTGEGDRAKATVNAPRTASIVKADRPCRFSRPTPATISAPVTAPAPEQLNNRASSGLPP